MKPSAPTDFWKISKTPGTKICVCEECGAEYTKEHRPNRPPDRPPLACSIKCREKLLKKISRKVG